MWPKLFVMSLALGRVSVAFDPLSPDPSRPLASLKQEGPNPNSPLSLLSPPEMSETNVLNVLGGSPFQVWG